MAAEEKFDELGQETEQKRGSARTAERFPIEFQVISEEESKAMERNYLDSRTSERDDSIGAGVGTTSGEEFTDAFSAAGATQVQMQMFQQTMRAIRSLDQKMDDLLSAVAGKRAARSKKMTKAMCIDLSAGGMRMLSGADLQKGTFVRLVMPLPPLHPVVVGAIGRVVKAGEVRLASGKTAYEHAVHFETIHESDREEIVSYSFKRQREEAFKAPAEGDGDGE